jgi:NAD+ synthase
MRTQFLSGYLLSAKMRAYVLGISGGVDSLLAGLLAQRAVRRVRDLGHEAQFIAVRMPYGVQADEADAGKAIATIDPDRTEIAPEIPGQPLTLI